MGQLLSHTHLFRKGKHHCTADLQCYRFLFVQTSKFVVNLTQAKQLNSNNWKRMSAVMIALNVSEHSLIKLNVDHCKSFVPQLNFGYYLTCILCDHQDKVDRSMALLRHRTRPMARNEWELQVANVDTHWRRLPLVCVPRLRRILWPAEQVKENPSTHAIIVWP